MEKTSLIIEGGGMRGIYAAGVLDCMIQHGFYWNNVYGVSAGACHGLSYISRQFDRARRVNIEYVSKCQYSGLFCLLRHGTYFGFDYIFRKIPLENPIDWHTFFKNQSQVRNFVITVTNATTGTAEYKIAKTPEEAMIWLEASSSLPIIGKPVKFQNQEWFDGGISDSIPIKKAEQDGHEKHILILTQPKGYQKKPVSKSTEKMLNLMYKKYPALVKANLERSQTYNETLAYISKQEEQGRAFVFRPEPQVITGRLCKDKPKLQNLYKAGYDDCKNRIQELKNFAKTVSVYSGQTD